jgi:hypothetical protein
MPPAPLTNREGSLLPDQAFHCRVVVAQPITPNDYPRLHSLVRTLAPDSGTAREFGDGLLWEQDSGFSALSLTINREAEGTVIRADLRLDGQLVAYHLGAVGASILAGLVATTMLPLLPSLGVGVAALVPSLLVARRLWAAGARRSMATVRRLVSQIAAGLEGRLE